MADALTELQVQLDNGQAAALDAQDMFALSQQLFLPCSDHALQSCRAD